MGSTTPSRLSSRTTGSEERWSAPTEGNRRKIAQAQRAIRTRRVADDLGCPISRERAIKRQRGIMAHLRRAFSRPAWSSANVRAIVSLLHSLAQASGRAPLPPARDPVFSVPDRFLPAAFERRRSLVL